MRSHGFVLTVVTGLLSCTTSALAQAPSLSGRITEFFNAVFAQSAFGIVVGVHQGPLPARVDLQRLRILVPPSVPPTQVCFAAATFDGIYSAKGVLDVSARNGGSIPVNVPNFSQYADRVAQYAGDELAVSLIVSRDCDLLPRAFYVPATYGGPMNTLTVALNTKPASNLRVTLTQNKRSVLGRCEAVRSRKTAAFMQVCTFELDPSSFAAGLAELEVSRKVANSAERREKLISVYISGPMT